MAMPVADRLAANIITFDVVDSARTNDRGGVIALAAFVPVQLDNGDVEIKPAVVGYIRGDVQALAALGKAINDCLLLCARTEGEAN
jgi:hypothetical protein